MKETEQTKFIMQMPLSMKELIERWASQQDKSVAAVIRTLIKKEEAEQSNKKDNE